MKKLHRKHPVHLPSREQFNVPIIVFVTVCTNDRRSILASDVAHRILREGWKAATSWLVGRYMIMPDHIHLFCAPSEPNYMALTKWVAFWKSYVSRHWRSGGGLPVWQRHFWDRQLRRGESYDAKWNYVIENPVRAGLASRSAAWPYQGEINVLRW